VARVLVLAVLRCRSAAGLFASTRDWHRSFTDHAARRGIYATSRHFHKTTAGPTWKPFRLRRR